MPNRISSRRASSEWGGAFRLSCRGPAFSAAPGSPEPISFWNCIARYTSYATTPAAVPNIATPAAISNHFSANMTCSFLSRRALRFTKRVQCKSRARTPCFPDSQIPLVLGIPVSNGPRVSEPYAASRRLFPCCRLATNRIGWTLRPEAGLLVAGISRNRPRNPIQVIQSANRNESSARLDHHRSTHEGLHRGPRFPRGKKWHDARQFSGR